MKKTLFALSIIPLLFCAFAMPALADDKTPPGIDDTTPIDASFSIKNPFNKGDNLLELMQSILTGIVLPLGGMLCVLGFIWAGFQYVTAQGNPGKIKTAHATLLYTAIGTAILLGALTIEALVRTTLTSILK